MRRLQRITPWVCSALLLVATRAGVTATAFAQEPEPKNEFALGIGATVISDQTVPNTNFFNNTVHSGKGVSFIFNYARQVRSFRWAQGSVGIEIPVIYNPDEDLNYGLNVIPEQYSSFFLTPAVRLSFARKFVVSPWVSLGGGVGYFVASTNLELQNAPNTGQRTKTTGVMHAGIGFDVPLPLRVHGLKFRFEARDNWSGVPPINVNTGKTRQHNYYVGAGVLFPF
jgi:hypothetical protein